MDNRNNMLQLCRLCLVKDDVNIPIFEEHGDIRQIFLKISSCLPVKVSREDKLPKKICDGCSFKLDTLYEFCNTSANAEKQLLTWLGEAGMNSQMVDGTITAVTQQIKPTDTFVKEETIEPPDIHNEDDDDKDYMFQQKFEESASAGPSATVTSNEEEEPPPKRARRTAAVKAAIALDHDSDDDDDDSGEPMTKVEDESEESEGEDQEPSFADAPSTSADDQPGPSGVGKDGVEAPDDIKSGDEEWVVPKIKIKKLKPAKLRNEGLKTSPKEKKMKKPGKYIPKLKPNHKARAWVCKICFEEFSTRKNLFDHRKFVHEFTEDTIKEEFDSEKYTFDENLEFFTCNNCSAEFQTREEVEKHVETHEEKYDCEICNETVNGALHFSAHMQTHREDKSFPCPLCNHITGRKSAMLTHIQRMHYRKYDFQCRTCGKCFNDATTFKEHENFHLGVKPFICVVCNREFIYSRYLIAHQVRNHRVRVLDKDSKTQCHMCPKMFARNETLVKHVVAKHLTYHEGPHEKKHLCDVCGQGFSRTDKLKIHYRKHTGEKPYSCVYCSKSFIKRDYLIMHERIHNGEKPYVCGQCGKSFNQGAPLRIHMRTHTGERPYKCPHCSTGCVSKGALNAHIKSCLNSL
ncbi:uncharacterized protein isoform X12 [Leptinotarsa decemlineata]|uniref:uncharacterized protein isoform X12 n=1 Tax=Leptinotarsa decemlineata TaxID=7539 RepID=UPI003D308CC0